MYHVKVHFLTQESPFLHRVFQKVRKSRQIFIYRDKIAYVRAHDFRPSPNLLAKALRAFAQLLPNFDVIAWFTIFCKPICPNHYLYAKQLWWIETQPPPFDHWSAGCRASWWTEGEGGQIKPPVFDHWQRRGAAEVIRGRNLSWQIVRHCLRSPQWTYGRAGQIATVATYGPACKTATTVLMILVLTGKLMT